MGRKKRLHIIKEIQKIRGSKLISFFTSDRSGNLPPFRVADDAIRPLHKHLESLGETDKIDLFLYTRGGSTNAGFGIAKLFCSYCKTFSVLVAHRCHSAGTLIALAADEIVMTKLGELSPVDPSVTSPFNPESKAGLPKPISVEDVFGFLDLAQNKAGLISETSKLETFRVLAEKSHPLALGNVNRAYNEIRLLSGELLTRHMNEIKDQAKIDMIKHELTETYSHYYPINRQRAKQIGLKVAQNLDPKLEKLMLDLQKDYVEELKLEEPFDPEEIYGTNTDPVHVTVNHAIIESEKSTECFVRNIDIAMGVVQPIQLRLPGMAQPISIRPHQSVVPKIVKFKTGKWVSLSEAGNCV